MTGQVRRDNVEPVLQRSYQRQKVFKLCAESVQQQDRGPCTHAYVSDVAVTDPDVVLSDSARASRLHTTDSAAPVHTDCHMSAASTDGFIISSQPEHASLRVLHGWFVGREVDDEHDNA